MANVALDPKKIRPLKGSLVSPGVMGYDGQIGDIVQADANNKAQLAASNAIGQVGMIVGVGDLHRTDGLVFTDKAITICWRGRVSVGDAILDPTARYFIGPDAGKLADAADVTVRSVGGAETDTILAFDGTKVE